MSQTKKIQERDLLYTLLRPYVDWALKHSYRSFRYVGRERLPKDAAIIFAPNHTNALMDALVILALDRRPKVFVARADIFRNPLLAKIFTWLKIMPIMRIRDGYEEVKKNNETIEKAVDVLRDGVPFCIFPEGTHQAKYSSLPLSKGIFRIALQAHEEAPEMPLYIVPVGIRYGNFFRFRSTARIEIGEPIPVGEFVADHADLTPQEQMNAMKELLTERMHQSYHYIPDDEDYESIQELCAAVVKEQAAALPRKQHRLDRLFTANKLTVERLLRLRREEPASAQALFAKADQAAALRKAHNISLASIVANRSIGELCWRATLLLLTAPYALAMSMAALPVVGIGEFICGKFKDEAFFNSVRYLIHLLLWPLMMVIYALVALFTLKWMWALVAIVLLLPAPIITQEWWRILRLALSDLRLAALSDLRHKYDEIRKDYLNQNL